MGPSVLFRPTAISAGRYAMPVRSLRAEAVELAVSRAAEDGMPFVRREPENWPLGIPAVAKADRATGQARHLHAVAVGET